MGITNINYFMYGDKSSLDFGVWISGESTYASPEKDVDTVSIPGRNGTLTLDNHRFQNVIIPYNAFIVDDFARNFDAFKAYLNSRKGYQKLADTYHPDHFRLARFISAIEPEMTQFNRHGKFVVNFDCDPRRFLKDGDRAKNVGNGEVLFNPTEFSAKPFIRAYGTGTFAIGSTAVQITSANEYTDIDCEIQEAYKGNVNCNGNITLTDGKFPEFLSGNNQISFAGITRLEITPRWWTI